MNLRRAMRVLIADDESMVNHALQGQAARLGHTVLGAAFDAAETLALARRLKPDVIILDMKMPDPRTGLDDPEAGLKAAQSIRDTCPTAIVLLTAYESPELVEKARGAGVGAYLIKPSRDNDLERAIAIATARFQDLQELRRANRTLEAALEELQQRASLFRVLSESAPFTFFRLDAEGTLTYLSPQWAQLAEASLDGDLTRGIRDFVHPEEAEGALASYREAMAEGAHWRHIHRFLTKTGAVKWVRALATPMYGPDGRFEGAVGILEDVTRQKAAGELRERAEKRESLGILAGGVAHDFNNLLGAIQGNLELLRFHLPEGTPSTRFLDHAQASVSRAAELSRMMLMCAGRSAPNPEPLDLDLTLHCLKQSLAHLDPTQGRLRFVIADELPLIEGDPGQIQQAIQALVLNAWEASEASAGSVQMEVALQRLTPGDLATLTVGQDLPPGDYVAVRVRDEGGGIAPEALPQIFDPFYTTKFQGRGLGLAATLGIVQAHKAGLRVESRPGEGSTFTLYFPPSGRFARSAPRLPEFAEAGPSGGRTVLLVDDEEALREAVGDLLVHMGYHVIYAVDGRDGVDKFAAHLGTIDLVLMDLTMPRLDGQEAFQEIRRLDPGVKVVLVSGYTEQDVALRFGDSDLAGFLHKPFRHRDLEALLDRLLGAPTA